MVLRVPGERLALEHLPLPEPAAGQVRVSVAACGVCRTDLHIVDGELSEPKLPLVLGHQIVGTVDAVGPDVELATGERIGIPWLGWTCGRCRYCRSGRENLCDFARFTGYHLDGGFAEAAVADSRYCFRLADDHPPLEAAPLLCAGLIGFRALALAGDGEVLGLYGFGAAAHVILQVARWQGRRVHAFTRAGDAAGQEFARSLGAAWAGASSDAPPEPLDAALVFAPAGELVPAALRAVAKGGVVVCAGIHMSDIPRSHTSCSGASGCSARSPTSHAGTARTFSRSLRTCPCTRTSSPSRSSRQTKPWTTCARARFAAPPSSRSTPVCEHEDDGHDHRRRRCHPPRRQHAAVAPAAARRRRRFAALLRGPLRSQPLPPLSRNDAGRHAARRTAARARLGGARRAPRHVHGRGRRGGRRRGQLRAAARSRGRGVRVRRRRCLPAPRNRDAPARAVGAARGCDGCSAVPGRGDGGQPRHAGRVRSGRLRVDARAGRRRDRGRVSDRARPRPTRPASPSATMSPSPRPFVRSSNHGASR